MNNCFRKAEAGEENIVYSMTAERVAWMDAEGIRQWNVTDYLNVYPLEYYRNHLEQLYVLTDEASGKILSAAVLLEQDERWDSPEPALYIHNFVSGLGNAGGEMFLQAAERHALMAGKKYLRLDSSADNEKLAAYYNSQGFMPCGFCREGNYYGILRQKEVK